MRIQLGGMYIYPTHTCNKWIVKNINIYENEDVEIEDKEDIEMFWKNTVNECIEIFDNSISQIEKKKESMLEIYSDILKTPGLNKEWESKLNELKRLTQNIIF